MAHNLLTDDETDVDRTGQQIIEDHLIDLCTQSNSSTAHTIGLQIACDFVTLLNENLCMRSFWPQAFDIDQFIDDYTNAVIAVCTELSVDCSSVASKFRQNAMLIYRKKLTSFPDMDEETLKDGVTTILTALDANAQENNGTFAASITLRQLAQAIIQQEKRNTIPELYLRDYLRQEPNIQESKMGFVKAEMLAPDQADITIVRIREFVKALMKVGPKKQK